MHIKALTAVVLTAVLSAVFVHTTHAMALSPSTTINTNGSTVTVAAGDSLSSIATNNGTTYVRLFDANSQIQNPDVIYPGEIIQIPSADAQLPDRMAAASPAPIATSSAVPDASVPRPAPIRAASAASRAPSSTGGSVWTELANCESGGNWSIDSGNGYYGGLQFTLSTWQSVGGTGYPNQASESEQIARAQTLQARQGWGAWPACSAKLGL